MRARHRDTYTAIQQPAGGSQTDDEGSPKPALCDELEGWGGEGGGRGFSKEGTHVCLWLIHPDEWQNHHSFGKHLSYNENE